MPRYFALISHHVPGSRDNFYYHTQRPDGRLSIGWKEVNPIGKQKDEIADEIRALGRTEWNVTNGKESLSLFANLQVGDIVFVRGDATIVDIGVITGRPRYLPERGHDGNDYCFKVDFSPFREEPLTMEVNNIPNQFRNHFLNEVGGRSRAMREITVQAGLTIFRGLM